GSYQIQATWDPVYNQPTNAPYSIYDGNTWLQTFQADQTQTSPGTLVGGASFQTLGTVTISGTTLNVVLGNNGNGKWVIADAVRIVETDAPPPPPPSHHRHDRQWPTGLLGNRNLVQL